MMTFLRALAFVALVGVASTGTAREGEARVLYSRAEAFAILFPRADTVTPLVYRVTPEARQRVERHAKRPLSGDTVVIWTAWLGGERLGYGFEIDEVGQHYPISFAIGLNRAGRVVDCLVTVYRESRGGEIGDARFRRQFVGRTVADPVRLRRDIVNVTGATYSCRAATDAVRKALAIHREFVKTAS